MRANLLGAGILFGGTGMFFYSEYSDRKIARELASRRNFGNSIEEKLESNIKYAASEHFKQNLNNAQTEGKMISELLIGVAKLSLPVALANELATTHKNEPVDYSDMPTCIDDTDNVVYERFQARMESLCQMLLDLSEVCDFAAFNQLSNANPTALDILVRINYPQVHDSLKSLLPKFKLQNDANQLEDIANNDLLLEALLKNKTTLAILLDPRFGNFNINKKDANGNTLAHRLMQLDKKLALENIFTLMEHGADFALKNNQQQSVRAVALSSGINATEFDSRVNVGLHWKMHKLAAEYVKNMSRDEYSAFVCNAAKFWGKTHPEQTAEIQKIIDRSLAKIWKGNTIVKAAWLKKSADLQQVILTTDQTAVEFNAFIDSTTDSWSVSRLQNYVRQHPMTKDEMAAFITEVVDFWLEANPELKDDYTESRYYQRALRRIYKDDFIPEVQHEHKHQELLNDLILTTDKYSYLLDSTCKFILDAWVDKCNLQAKVRPFA